MKANELRIGNWINYLESGDVQLKSKTELINVFYDLEMPYPHSRPIPLTEEWLLKLGFEKYETAFYIPYKAMFLCVCIDEINKYVGLCKKEDYILYDGYAHIQYVHQLQNLYFALTGNELTIKETH